MTPIATALEVLLVGRLQIVIALLSGQIRQANRRYPRAKDLETFRSSLLGVRAAQASSSRCSSMLNSGPVNRFAKLLATVATPASTSDVLVALPFM
jgi:hypothetical protein